MTETWLHNGVYDAEVSHDFPGYSILGDGEAVYLRDDLTGEVLGSFDNGVCEMLVVFIHQLNTVAAVIYRPPDTKLAEFTPVLSNLDTILSELPDPQTLYFWVISIFRTRTSAG